MYIYTICSTLKFKDMKIIKVIDSKGNVYDSIRCLCREKKFPKTSFLRNINKRGFYISDGVKYFILNEMEIGSDIVKEATPIEKENIATADQEYQNYLSAKKNNFEYFKFDSQCLKTGEKYAIALFSDAHIEETVHKESVLGLNEYNTNVAKYRIERYFVGLSECLKKDNVNSLVFACLGDIISGFIHDSLQQENGMTPPEAVLFGQSLIVSGLKYLTIQNPNVGISFIGVYGNHSRVTKKIQYDNGFKLSYEYIMYQNIKSICELSGMNIQFNLPQSEIALLDMPDGNRFLFFHGYQIKSGGTGTVCGIYPSLNRLSMKWDKIFKQNKIYLGHFHNIISIPNATVNGSIIGYNAFAMSNGMAFEEPAQVYELYDDKIGYLLTRKIYCK
jgi:hypothetical protein